MAEAHYPLLTFSLLVNMKQSSTTATTQTWIAEVAKLYAKGDPKIADLTYGKKVLWRNVNPQTFACLVPRDCHYAAEKAA